MGVACIGGVICGICGAPEAKAQRLLAFATITAPSLHRMIQFEKKHIQLPRSNVFKCFYEFMIACQSGLANHNVHNPVLLIISQNGVYCKVETLYTVHSTRVEQECGWPLAGGFASWILIRPLTNVR